MTVKVEMDERRERGRRPGRARGTAPAGGVDVTAPTSLGDLRVCLRGIGTVAVAVSGGVDSMTLAVVAGRTLGRDARMYHAVSPAVPSEATRRVHAYADREGWTLDVMDAGEFGDARYMANPANRCYFCKTNLYGSMAARATGTLVSGTNVDDLGDFRPGLAAAGEHAVRHPYVEAGFRKDDVRALARSLELDDLAELPAAPLPLEPCRDRNHHRRGRPCGHPPGRGAGAKHPRPALGSLPGAARGHRHRA